jgi:hypothetical protein
MTGRSDTRSLLIWNVLCLIRRVSRALQPGILSADTAAAREDLAKAERLILAVKRLEAEDLSRPAQLIELWVRAHGQWRRIETFDPASPQFTRSAAPADYAWFEARRQGALMMKADARIDAYEVRREPR